MVNNIAVKNLGILLSGRGSNFVAIADSIDAGRIPDARIAVVISNRADAPGIETAKRRGLNALVIASKGKAREAHDREMVAALKENNVHLICLAGYMRLLSPEFVRAFESLARVATRAGVGGTEYRLHTPLMSLDKAGIVRLGASLGVDFRLTHSCYDPAPAGAACGGCDACVLRRKGFRAAGVPDPTRYALPTPSGR